MNQPSPASGSSASRICIVACVLVTISLFAPPAVAAPGDHLWHDATGPFDGPVWTSSDVALSPDGSTVFVAGTRVGGGEPVDWDARLSAYDATTGELEWRSIHLSASGPEIAVAPDGSVVYVTAYDARQRRPDFIALAFDAATGERIWGRRHPTALDVADYASDIAADASSVYLTGTQESGRGRGLVAMALDAADGDRLWLTRVRGSNASGLDLAVQGRRVVVGGYRVPIDRNDADGWIGAFRAATGALLWSRTRRSSPDDGDYVHSVAIAPGGDTYAAGVTDDAAYVEAIDSVDGTRTWIRISDPGRLSDFDQSATIALGGDGSVYVTIERWQGEDYIATLAFAADGAPLWSVIEDDTFEGGGPAAITVTPDDSMVLVAGYGSMAFGDGGGSLVLAYDADVGGDPLWHHHGGAADSADDIAVAPDGATAFVAGKQGSGTYVEAFDLT